MNGGPQPNHMHPHRSTLVIQNAPLADEHTASLWHMNAC